MMTPNFHQLICFRLKAKWVCANQSCVKSNVNPQRFTVKECTGSSSAHTANKNPPPPRDDIRLASVKRVKEGGHSKYKKEVSNEDNVILKATIIPEIKGEAAQLSDQNRKRRLDEKQRSLDLDKRTKQRLEKLRFDQKKEEEITWSKDLIRSEVCKNHMKLESSCNNLASLLHLMGISVDDWPKPLAENVQKELTRRQLFIFHPDRVSRTGIQEQVQAEEKFKLGTRLKEKFLPPS